MTKIALITGITGQDGSYLAELLLNKNYYVWGIIRRTSNINTDRINNIHLNKKLILRYGDLSDASNLLNIVNEIKNKYTELDRLEIYNLAAMSHVKVSFDIPEYTGDINALGTVRLLEIIRLSGIQDKIRFYQASTSELYGQIQENIQNEMTPFYPRSPYAVSKLYAFWIVKNYREAYNIFAVNGILFNHESSRRGPTFISRKITRGLGMILKGERDKLVLGNLDASRDWGHAQDYVEGMWRMLQTETPSDFVLSTGESHTVREFVEKSFKLKGFEINWKGHGINEIGYDINTGRELIFVDEKYFRPTEVYKLLGDSKKAKDVLKWEIKISFDMLVKDMVNHDC
jgi:GDPmannose 4,6-dehydratase